tara:strand:- start:4451 stop:4738 length:288 start_codon:yes stop_codon:yes gene_type:complete
MSENTNPYYRAAYSKYVAEQDEAVANLLTLFNRPVGIGEHTDFVKEIDKWINQGSGAIGKMQFLANVFTENEDNTVSPAEPQVPQEVVTTSAQGT